MVFTQVEPKKIYIGSTEIKKVYLGSTQIRPAGGGGWQPGVNTLAYYPLEADTNDYSGNNRNLTNNGITFSTANGSSINVGVFNGSSNYASLGSSLSVGTTYTILAWYWHNTSNNGMVYCQGASASLYPSLGLGYGVNNSKVSAHSGTGGNNTWLTSTNSSNNGKWVLGVVVFNNGSVSLYENNVLTGTGNLSAPGTGGEGLYVGLWRAGYNFWGGNISHLIIENKVRTQQEISDYYDQTKGDYGISGLQSITPNISPNVTPNITPDTPGSGTGDVLTI